MENTLFNHLPNKKHFNYTPLQKKDILKSLDDLLKKLRK